MANANLNQFEWYHGTLSRTQTEDILAGRAPGSFLVRNSGTIPGDYVLSVSESKKVSHYIINNKGSHYQIGEQTFPDLPQIIEFYKKHFLDTTTLKEPVVKELKETVKALYNFSPKDSEDLGFKKGDILTVVKKPEDNWWIAVDSKGKRGLIPKPYVKIVSMGQSPPAPAPVPVRPTSQSLLPAQEKEGGPWFVRAINQHSAPYDETKLPFQRGDVIKVLKKNDDGNWFGELDARTGWFPFTYVENLPAGAGEYNGYN